ncbi:ATP-binding protein [Nonomuraea sp. 3-1Str]|uniref:ATP-binding protein n=1 Tax=Nonomuraea sp. 3-1Str TaxID=2929801 RepID=UPI00285E444E|nr:ATP-binding protein [Nonomuraea sp. 3-1Str]MDR8415083.1 ATP-binding protein [Nonomuraea sp. 3-1Str]
MAIAMPAPVAHREYFAGVAASIPAARSWALGLLPADCPRAGDVALVVSELATNAILHSASGQVGGRFAVQVELEPGTVGLTVIDLGPALVPLQREPREGGHGLELVQGLADVYDVRAEPASRTVCCWLDWQSPEVT